MTTTLENNQSIDTKGLFKELNLTVSYNTQTKRVKKQRTSYEGKQLTVPDQALSIRTILERFSRGQSIPKSRTPIYSDEDYSELEKMDTFEKLDLLQQTNEFIQETQNALNSPQDVQTTTTAPASESKSSDANEPA